jgi:polysaccharide chain length determinant protein (PEP-CTERM system associated)
MIQQLDMVLEQLRGMWRFRWVGMLAAWVTLLFGLFVITILPDRYEASATVFVDTQTALNAATRDLTIEANVESQLQRVREALLGDPQLIRIADETGLTAKAETPRERQEVVEKMRRDIQIHGGLGGHNGGAGTFVISYRNKSRDTSLKVVDRFVNTFVEGTLVGKLESSEQAQEFLRQRIAEHEQRLRDAEEALAAFKKRHVGLLPDERNDYVRRLQEETAEMERIQTQLVVANNRRTELQRQLRGEQPLLPSGAEDGVGTPLNRGGDTATRLRESQRQLDELLLSYTDKHPRVIELRNIVAELQARVDEEIAAARRGDSAAAARSGLTASPVYQTLQMQYNEVGVEIAALQADLATRRQRVESLRAMINTAPEVEAQYSRLNRDYDVIKAEYESFVEQLGRTRLAEQATQTGMIRFDVVDPARADFDPVFPKRPLFAIAALVGAVGVGMVVAFVLNLIRPVIDNARRLEIVTGFPVLGAVSMTWIERHDLQLRRSTARLAVALLGMVFVCAVYLVIHRPLASAVQSLLA